MLTDANLKFSALQAATGDSENTLDLRQKTIANGNKPFFAVVYCLADFSTDSKLTVEVQESDEKTGTYKTIASSGEVAVAVGKQVAVPLPIKHKQFLKLKYIASGTQGKVDAYLTESVDTWEPVKGNSYWMR